MRDYGSPWLDVVFDLDGTLADATHRLGHIQKTPKDWDAFFEACVDDTPIKPMVALLRNLQARDYVHIEIWTGRSDQVRVQTEEWLVRNGILTWRGSPHEKFGINGLRMRKQGDHRSDVEIKREWLHERRAAGIDVRLAFEDRDRVVAMWREEGVICNQVAHGNF